MRECVSVYIGVWVCVRVCLCPRLGEEEKERQKEIEMGREGMRKRDELTRIE